MVDTALQLVGHRGYPARYPENSLRGFLAAIGAGAKHLELDVQMCADGELVVLHDDNLMRTAGIERSVFDVPSAQCETISVHEPARFGARFEPEPLLTLPHILQVLAGHDGLQVYVEVKEESIEHFGLQQVMQKLATDLQAYRTLCAMISFSAEAVAWLRGHGGLRTGWVLECYDDAHRQAACRLQPDFLICNQRKVLAHTELWQGSWQWMLYGVENLELLLAAQRCGAALAETDRVGDLLREREPLADG